MFSWYRKLIRESGWFIQEHVYGRKDLVNFERNQYDLAKHRKLSSTEDVSSRTEVKEKGLAEKTS